MGTDTAPAAGLMIAQVTKALDFFCGAGGLTRGMLDAGIEVLAGIDIDGRLRKTYESNNQPSQFVEADVRSLDIQALRDKVGIGPDDRVVYAACTPCQPFSTLNQKRGSDNRKGLLLAFAELVEQAPPDVILVENVPGLGNAYGREIYESFVETLAGLGFGHIDAKKIDAFRYGVPQVRKRFVLLASREGPIALPKADETGGRTVRSAIESLGPPGPESPHPNHVARVPPDAHIAILQAIPKDGGSRSDVTDTSLLLECHRRNPNVHRDVFGRMKWDAPAPTLTACCTDVYCGRFAHPDEDRGLTLREAAALQTFPNDYRFHGTFFHIAQQIGNAVPVELARRLSAAMVGTVPGDT